jgi:hypothetical protein
VLHIVQYLIITVNTTDFYCIIWAPGYMFQPLVVIIRPLKYIKLKFQ